MRRQMNCAPPPVQLSFVLHCSLIGHIPRLKANPHSTAAGADSSAARCPMSNRSRRQRLPAVVDRFITAQCGKIQRGCQDVEQRQQLKQQQDDRRRQQTASDDGSSTQHYNHTSNNKTVSLITALTTCKVVSSTAD